MPTRLSPPPPPPVDKSKYLAIGKPYPPKVNLNNYPDQRALVLWLACCAGKEVLRALFYRPSSPERVVIEVHHQFDRFHDLVGQHVWSEFLIDPTKEDMGKSSTVLYSSFNTGRLFRGGWTRVEIEEHWFLGWSADNPYNYPFIKFPYPKTLHCNGPSSSEEKSGEPVCRSFPQEYFAWPLPPPAPSGKTAATSNIVSVPSASSQSTKSFFPPSTQSPAPSSVVANPRKHGPPTIFSRTSAGASRAPSTVGSSIARSWRGDPPSFPGLGRRLSSPSRTSERFNWSVNVERFELKPITDPPIRTPGPSHSSLPERRQIDDPLGSIEPSRVYDYNEEDEPRHSTEAALTDLFEDGFFVEASSAKNGCGETTALGPDDPNYDPWNPPGDAPENLWEGYDTPQLELPTKIKKNGDWTCPLHGPLCIPGICKERARFERDERMRNNREKWEEERIERETPGKRRGRRKKGTKVGAVTGEGPPDLRGNSSSATTATTTTSSSTDNGSDSDTSRNQGHSVPLPLDQDDSSLDGFRLNGGSDDTQSADGSASHALDSVAGSNYGENNQGARVPKSRATHTSSVISHNSRAAPPASVSSSGWNKGPTPLATPSVKSSVQVSESPTSPLPATQQPAYISDARSSANQNPSVGRHSVSAPSVSVASSNNGTGRQRSVTGSATRKSTSEARSSVVSSRARAPSTPSSRASSEYAYPIAKWLADVRAKTTSAKPKVSKGARKRRNKAKTARAQAQEQEKEALATVLEAEIEVEPPFGELGNEWGNPNVVW